MNIAMNDELLVEAEPAVGRDTMGAAFDADELWKLANLPDLTARLTEASRAGGFEGVALVVASPDAEGAFLRLVEEGRRLASTELAPDTLGAFIVGLPERSSLPFRWTGHGEANEHLPIFEAGVLRDRGPLPVALSGICVPVRAGLRRVGGVLFLGRGRPELRSLDILALRIFSTSWFARYCQLEAVIGERGHVTPRERECLQLASNGLTSEAIARRLALSKHTVDHHLVSATVKLKAANRAHAIAESLRLGIVT